MTPSEALNKGVLAFILALLLGVLTQGAVASNTQMDTISLEDKDLSIFGLAEELKQEPTIDELRFEEKAKKQKDLSKKFGPLVLKFKPRSLGQYSMRFRLDLMQTFDIIAQKDPKLFLKPGDRHFIISPHTKEEVKKTIHYLRSRFHRDDSDIALERVQ